MADVKFKKKALWQHTSTVTIEPGKYVELQADVLTSAKYLSFNQKIVKNSASEYSFKTKASITCKITYAGDLEKDTFLVLLNRDRNNTTETFVNTAVLQLGEKDVIGITIKITNNDAENPLIVESMGMYESKDLATQTLESGLAEVAEFKQNCEYIELLSDGSGFGYKFERENPQNFIFLTNSTGALTGIARQEDGYVTQIRTKNV